MKKYKPKTEWSSICRCPICGVKAFDYFSMTECGWGTVEQHGECLRCGYIIEQA